jgi:hypothetical protein
VTGRGDKANVAGAGTGHRTSCVSAEPEATTEGRREGCRESRRRKPRPPLVVRPSFVSQDTSFAVLGLTPRKFLDLLVPRCGGEVVRIGRTVLVPLEVAEARLRCLAGDSAAVEAQLDDEDGQPASVDQVLASVGMRRRVGR